MSRLVRVKADSTLNISVEERLFENIRRAHAWYTSKKMSIPVFLIFFVIDTLGFNQVLELTIANDPLSRGCITAALAVAFEIAPLYIGYSICLKCYNLGKRIHKWVFIFSCSACILGIIGNIYYRLGTMDIAYVNKLTGEVSSIGMPITVLMCLLPVITSLINLVIGCLTFDPLQSDLLQLSKKLAKLELRKQQIKAYLEEFNDEETLQKTLEKEEEECYEKVKQEIHALQTALKTYIIIRTSSSYNVKNE